MTSQKHKHLTLSDRMDIQLGLENRKTFKDIAQIIQKDPTTVAKEVKRNNRELFRLSTASESTLCL